MHHSLILDLAIVTGVAALSALLLRRLGQPAILGYLLAGLIVGPYLPIPLFADPHRIEEFAEVGVVLVLFSVGLDLRIRRLAEILPASGLTALVQIGALLWAGTRVGSFLGWSTAASVCLGAALAISSTMVVSAVLRDTPVDPDVRGHVFGVLVIQDLVAIVLMAVVTALAAGQTLEPAALVGLLTKLGAVIVALLVAGMLLLPPLVRAALGLGTEAVVVLVAASAFGFATTAEAFGFSPALGAFLSGIAIAESNRGREVERALEPLRDLFSALFFVSIGMTVDPAVALDTLPLALLLVAVVVGMQLVSVTISGLLSGAALRRSVFAALALGQIGELSFIIASIAIGGGAMPPEALSALVTVATITTFSTSFLLRRGERLVAALDHVLPRRITEGLAAYQAFVRRASRRREGPTLRGTGTAVLLDWTALLVLVAIRSSLRDALYDAWAEAVDIGMVVAAVPFMIGLVRSGWRLVGIVRERSGEASLANARAVAGLATVAAILAIGVPAMGIVGPLLGHGWVEICFAVALLGALVVAGLRLGGLEGETTSGVARFALHLAEQAAGEDAEPIPGDGPIAGLDYHPIVVDPAAEGAGRGIGELDLRVRTGATVVAVQRGETTTTLPGGGFVLRAGDVVAASGSPAAVERARALLGRPEAGVE